MAKALVNLFNIQYEATKIDKMLHKTNSRLRKHSLYTLNIIYAMQSYMWVNRHGQRAMKGFISAWSHVQGHFSW